MKRASDQLFGHRQRDLLARQLAYLAPMRSPATAFRAQNAIASSSRTTLQDLESAKGLHLSGLPSSTLPADISRFLHQHGSRRQHLQQVTLLLDRQMQFQGSALVAFHEPEVCAQVHASLMEASKPTKGQYKPALRIGQAGPLAFQRVDLYQQPWAELSTNMGGGGPRSLLVDGQKKYFGRTIAIEGFTEDVHPHQVLGLVKSTGVDPIPSAPNAVRPSESIQRVPGTENTTRRPIYLARFNTVSEACRAARTLNCTTAKLHNDFYIKSHVIW